MTFQYVMVAVSANHYLIVSQEVKVITDGVPVKVFFADAVLPFTIYGHSK